MAHSKSTSAFEETLRADFEAKILAYVRRGKTEMGETIELAPEVRPLEIDARIRNLRIGTGKPLMKPTTMTAEEKAPERQGNADAAGCPPATLEGGKASNKVETAPHVDSEEKEAAIAPETKHPTRIELLMSRVIRVLGGEFSGFFKYPKVKDGESLTISPGENAPRVTLLFLKAELASISWKILHAGVSAKFADVSRWLHAVPDEAKRSDPMKVVQSAECIEEVAVLLWLSSRLGYAEIVQVILDLFPFLCEARFPKATLVLHELKKQADDRASS